jgi:hypothetical protein
MSRRHSLHAIMAIGLLVPVGSTPLRHGRDAASTPPPHQPSATPANPGGIRLLNRGPVGLTVEIRVALGPDCSVGRTAASRELRSGAAWVIRSSQPICVRREKLELGGRRVMQAWERKQPVDGRVEEVEL